MIEVKLDRSPKVEAKLGLHKANYIMIEAELRLNKYNESS